MNRTQVSVIVVALNEEENLRRCLSAVQAQKTEYRMETIVVDSASRDRTAAVARSFGARVLEIPADAFQHGRTRQMASELAEGEYLVYLVADAVPADEHWLDSLVRAVADDTKTAGAYSRQIPRQGADPLEAFRLQHRRSSGLRREVREISPEEDFWAWSPEERFRFCEFDDVSCCRRRSLLARFPIPAVEWAEDLLWAKEVLLAGYRLVYEPASVVRHSHADTIRHAFRRGFLDQAVVRRWFGVLYFKNWRAWVRGYPRLYTEQARAILAAEPETFSRLRLLAWNTLRLLSETAGNFGAAHSPRPEHVVLDLLPLLAKDNPLRNRFSRQVMETEFTLQADTRRVLFMNPQAAALADVKIPAGTRLKFSVALNPACRPFRREPVLFVAAVDGEPIWKGEVSAGPRGTPPAWTEVELELGKWAGRRRRLLFLTRAGNTDHAWAGWGEPRIVRQDLGAGDRAYNFFLERLEAWVRGSPLRHP